jgi:glc operon protein GlcG
MLSQLIRAAVPVVIIAASSSGYAAPVAPSASLPTQPILTLEAARIIASAAEAKAAAEDWPCVVAVVDGDGLPILVERMDHAMVPGGVYLAPGKARTAALFRRPSRALEEAINNHRPAAETARGFVMMTGGVPVTVDRHIVGAIGVSSDTPQHDTIIANAGVAALAQ